MTETSHVTLPSPPQQPEQVWSKLGPNKWQVTRFAETVFRQYLDSHCSGVTLTSEMILPNHAPQPAQDWTETGSKEEYITLGAETVFGNYLASHCSGMTQK
jgi:hypothetical protein